MHPRHHLPLLCDYLPLDCNHLLIHVAYASLCYWEDM